MRWGDLRPGDLLVWDGWIAGVDTVIAIDLDDMTLTVMSALKGRPPVVERLDAHPDEPIHEGAELTIIRHNMHTD